MCSINDMLEQLRTSRQSIVKQIDVLGEILDKSNNVLLQIETERTKESPTQEISNLKPYSYAKDTEKSLARAMELYQHLPQNEEHNGTLQNDLGFADYLLHNCQNLQYLSSNVRKLLVVGEIMSKVTDKSQQSEDIDE